MIGWLARYEVTVDSGTEVMGAKTFRFTDLRHVRWALQFGQAPDLAAVKITARDRWTGRRLA